MNKDNHILQLQDELKSIQDTITTLQALIQERQQDSDRLLQEIQRLTAIRGAPVSKYIEYEATVRRFERHFWSHYYHLKDRFEELNRFKSRLVFDSRDFNSLDNDIYEEDRLHEENNHFWEMFAVILPDHRDFYKRPHPTG